MKIETSSSESKRNREEIDGMVAELERSPEFQTLQELVNEEVDLLEQKMKEEGLLPTERDQAFWKWNGAHQIANLFHLKQEALRRVPAKKKNHG